MKRLLSLSFIVILLLNVMGYYGVFLGLQYRHDKAMSAVLDADTYDESQTLTITIPVSVPYMSDNAEFVRVNGKFEHQGEVYRLVKQKYAKDTLTVVCIKDTEHKRINTALSNYVKTFTDTPADGADSKLTINFLKDYLSQTFTIASCSQGWLTGILQNATHKVFISTFVSSVVHPPERA